MVGNKSSHRNSQFLTKNTKEIVFISIFLLGFILRVLFINSREIAYDDSFSYFLARQSFSEIIKGTAADTMPPLYYFLLHIWMQISQELWFLRLLNVMINLFTGLIVYFLSKDIFDRNSALITTILFMISPFQIYHAQELRMYTLLLFGQLGYFYATFRSTKADSANKVRWIVLAVLFGTIAMYSHNLAIIGLVSINVIFFFNKYRKKFWEIISIQILIFLFSTPWLIFLPQQIEKVQRAFWTQNPGLIDIIQAILSLFSFLPMSTIWMGIALIIIIQILALVLIFLIRSKSQKNIVLAFLFISPPVMLFVLSYLVYPVFVPRIFIISSIWFFIIVGHYISINSKSVIGRVNFVLLIFLSAFSLSHFYTFQSFPRSSFKELANQFRDVDPVTPIIHDNKLSFFPTMFYVENKHSYYIKDEPGSPNDTLALDSQTAIGYRAVDSIDQFLNRDSIIFVTFEKTISEYEENNINHPVIDLLSREYSQINKLQIDDLLIFYCGDK